ncbi:MAG: alcohol dehydrogenase catalytic domain-containing protein [Nitrososphaerota archaeon]
MISRAAILKDFNSPMEIGQISIPEPKKDEVILRIKGAGVCASDLEIIHSNIVREGFKLPFVLGHENAGVIERVGEDVKGFEIGDTCLVYSVWGDMTCEKCRKGEYNLCPRMAVPGQSFYYGGFSEYMFISSYRWLRKINSKRPEEYAPLADAGTTSYAAVRKALDSVNYDPDSTIIIYGIGGIATYTIQIIKSMFPTVRVIACSRSEEKLSFADKLGADISVKPDMLKETVRDFKTTSIAAIDLVGSQDSFSAINDSIGSYDASIIMVGLHGSKISFPVFDLVGGEKKIIGSNYGTWSDFDSVCKLMDRNKIRSYIIPFSLDEINDALTMVSDGKNIGRVVITP